MSNLASRGDSSIVFSLELIPEENNYEWSIKAGATFYVERYQEK